ncbi:MAG: glutamine-hydrolyzing carbamoyl-phosphate synthase small subunit [Nitrososphaerota archaeon]|nr:glutamine-hydrolyzing carbamoyl-phosphate synthase small subunit [Nitrososphaerota archaeon]
MKALFALEDGSIFYGKGFGAEGEAYGEAVFCTSMTGYEEALTDPSYNGQILIMTYPLIGNYGIHESSFQSERIQVEGFVVMEACKIPSHHRPIKTIHEFLRDYGIPAIEGVDTRALTIKIRKYGVMKSALITYTNDPPNIDEVLRKTRNQPSTSEIDLVREVTRRNVERIDVKGNYEVVLIDCGVKKSIIDALLRRGVNITIVPANVNYEEIMDYDPDGVVISNGPGDPAYIRYVIETVEKLIGKLPMLGICLGHQLLALASGAKTYKMKFGHRGSNHPVKDLITNRVYITSQNHGFAVEPSSLDGTGFKISSINVNDRTVEGLIHRELPIISTQYHPEGHSGPRDAEYVFDLFLNWLREY